MIRNLIWDMGEVLMRYQPQLTCLRLSGGDETLARQLLETVFLHPDWQLADRGGLTEQQKTQRALERCGSNEALRALVPMAVQQWVLDGLYPRDGADTFLRRMHQKGYRLYLLSNICFCYPHFLYKLPGRELFSGMMFSCEEGMMKPDPAIFQRFLDRWQLQPQECVFVDDLEKNVLGAQQVGILGYHLPDGDFARMEQELQL